MSRSRPSKRARRAARKERQHARRERRARLCEPPPAWRGTGYSVFLAAFVGEALRAVLAAGQKPGEHFLDPDRTEVVVAAGAREGGLFHLVAILQHPFVLEATLLAFGDDGDREVLEAAALELHGHVHELTDAIDVRYDRTPLPDLGFRRFGQTVRLETVVELMQHATRLEAQEAAAGVPA